MTLRISRLTAAASVMLIVGCSSLTDVDSPDVVQPQQLSNAAGAEALTTGALASIMGPFMTFAYNTAVFSDEMKLATAFTSFADIDFRTQSLTFNEYGPILMHRVRTQTTQAIEARKQFAPTPRARIGQLFATKGLAELFLGETSCNGTPLTDVRGTEAFFSGPLTSDSILKVAISNFDSALVYAADSARVLNLARVARGRALLNRGQYAQAASAVAGVPTTYVYNAEATLAVAGQINLIWNANNLRTATVIDREGGNGLNFVSAADPRVPTIANGVGADGVTPVSIFAKYSGQASAIPMVTGIEARLIEAEAALQANRNDTSPTGAGWLGVLNNLRATAITPAMAPLADPGNFDARVDMLFRERAFWLYGTGHRMGDLRRILRQYGRTEAQTWPKGPYKGGASYGNEVVFILTLSEQANPNVRVCADKNP
jgi:starch-binding outer membrane protein, SusD/RagB family